MSTQAGLTQDAVLSLTVEFEALRAALCRIVSMPLAPCEVNVAVREMQRIANAALLASEGK